MRVPVPHTIDGAGDEERRVQIAQRTGAHLTDETISEEDRRAAELIARALAEDAVERVRCELSRAISHAKYLPKDLALKLAHDVDSVSCPFLEVTEVFSDDDWKQLLWSVTRSARMAVARRKSMTESLAESIAELGDAAVAVELVENRSAPMTEGLCNALVCRFGPQTWVLNKMAMRGDLSADIVIKLATHVSVAAREKLLSLYPLPDFIEPVAVEAETVVILETMKNASAEHLLEVAEMLQQEGKLTPLLMFAALRERRIGFLEAALSVLAERSLEHVRSVVHRAKLDVVKQLLTRARVPASLQTDFWKEMKSVRGE